MLALAASLRLGLPPSVPRADAPVASAAAWRLASLGRGTPAATLAWTEAVRRFTRQSPGAGDVAAPLDARWLLPALEPIAALDPRWSMPWMYGALMARHLGDTETQQEVLQRAMEAFPTEHWFPYALGMARYLDHDDLQGAAAWLEHASTLPDAPPVHAEAARAMRARLTESR